MKNIIRKSSSSWSVFHFPYLARERGFTLLELVVVLAIFVIVMGVMVNIFVSMIQSQKKTLADQELLSQESYALEYISRTIREAVKDDTGNCLAQTGRIYVLSHYDSLSDAYGGIKFVTREGICQEFFLDGGGIVKEAKDGQAPQAIMSEKFKVGYVKFIINGDKGLQAVSDGDSVQPLLTMLLKVQSKIIQTTVSQNVLNI